MIENKTQKVIDYLKKEFPNKIQMFDTPNIVGDAMSLIYNEDGIIIKYCYAWNYIEIFGVTDDEYEKIFMECGY